MRNRTYRHEMDDGAHRQLLDALLGARGMVVVCGYPTEMYDQALAGWRSNTTNARISAGRGAGTRTEKIWINPRCARIKVYLDVVHVKQPAPLETPT